MRRAMLRTPMGVTAAILLLVILLTAIVAPIVWGERSLQVNLDVMSQGSSWAHPFGTDALGRDILLRVLVATRVSITLALAATLLGVLAGTLLGTAPSVLPRPLARLVTWFVNLAVAFPALLLALFFAVIFGVGTQGAVLAVGLAMAPAFARLTQTLASSVAGRDFVAAARVAHVGRFRILVRHVLPNIGEPLIVNATIGAGGSLLAFAGMSFLGIGVQAPTYDWGRLLGEGLGRIYTNPAAALGPGLAVVAAGLAFNLFGETAASILGVRTPRRLAAEPRQPAEPQEPPGGDDETVLRVRNLVVGFPTPQGWTTPVRGISFDIRRAEAVGVVGESGSGKSLTALAVSRLIEPPGTVTADELTFAGRPILDATDCELRTLLGSELAMVFQDPATAFNPTQRIGRQLAEVAEQHQGMRRAQALAHAADRLRAVHVPAPEQRVHRYPHEFSGGMRQRAMIAMGLMGTPRLVIADEPTTALDVTVQRQVLRLLAQVRASTDAAVLLISHDITVVAQTCDRVLVMYAGRIVEDLPTEALTGNSRHPYTRALLDVVPDLSTSRTEPLAVIPGRPPEPASVGAGCAFASRCTRALDRCTGENPELATVDVAHRIACWNPMPALAAEGVR